MHSLSHTLSHRGPGARSARTRWQPYSSTTIAKPARSPTNYLNTPASSVTSSSSSPFAQQTLLEPPRKLSANQSCQTIGQSRESLKNRYVTRLIDQAVNSLCDIWHPEDIPSVFRTSSRTASFGPNSGDSQSEPIPLVQTPYLQHARNVQLPSPISPSTQASPFCPVLPSSTSSAYRANSSDTPRSSQLLPLKGFVHEVLRRSRTSTGVLQTALCYLEAVRGKIPELLRQENSQTASSCEEEVCDRIIIAMDLDSESMVSDDMVGDQTYDLEFARLVGLPEPLTAPPSPMSSSSSATPSSSKRPSPPLPPLPLVPSCLLCPRRTFLACLILASKFMQDRSYSNRAWAKLVGLPPREISRCERALGEALDWRLWVGKSATVAGRKPVARSKSDGELSFGVTSTRATDAAQLRRNATAPAGTFSMDAQAPFVGFFGDGLPQVIVEEPEQVPSVYVNTSQYARSLPGDATELLRDHDDLSPPMSTPTLFYSPMSSISSSSDDGDRTIQMSGFLDLPTPLPGTLAPFQGYDNLGSAPFAQDSLKGGVFLRGPRASSVMIMDSTPMPPMLNPAVTPYGGAMRLPSLYEALGDLTPAFANAKGGHGLSEVQDVSYSGNWRDVPPMN